VGGGEVPDGVEGEDVENDQDGEVEEQSARGYSQCPAVLVDGE